MEWLRNGAFQKRPKCDLTRYSYLQGFSKFSSKFPSQSISNFLKVPFESSIQNSLQKCAGSGFCPPSKFPSNFPFKLPSTLFYKFLSKLLAKIPSQFPSKFPSLSISLPASLLLVAFLVSMHVSKQAFKNASNSSHRTLDGACRSCCGQLRPVLAQQPSRRERSS